MRTFLFTLHILTCVSLVIVVLIQRGKGANMGAMLGGGGSQTVFGARGAGNFLTKLTTGAAIVFMTTSLSLAYLATQDSKDTIFDGAAVEETLPEATLDEATPAVDPSLLEEIEPAAAGGLEEIDDAISGTAGDPQEAPATP